MSRLARYLEDQNEKPTHKHDCANCIFLGNYVQFNRRNERVVYDLYFHPRDADVYSNETVVARFGEEGDYYSGIESGLPPLIEAKSRVFRYFEINTLRN